MLKKLFFAFVLAVCGWVSASGQSVRESFQAYANTASVSLVSGNTYQVTLTQFVGGIRPAPNMQWDVSDILVGDVLWAACARFPVTQIISLSGNAVLRVQDVDNTGFLDNGQRVALVREITINGYPIPPFPSNADGNAGSLAGIAPDLFACMLTHYTRNASLATNEVRKYTGAAGVQPGYTPGTTDPRIAQNDAGEVWVWDGSAWSKLGAAGGGGENAYVTVNATASISPTVKQVNIAALSASATLTLPTCNGANDAVTIQFFKSGADTFPAIIAPASGQTFTDGASSKSLFSTGNTFQCTCNSSAWFFAY